MFSLVYFKQINFKEESIMFGSKDKAVNEVSDLITEFQSRLDEIKRKYNIQQSETQAFHVPVIKPLKTFAIEIDPKMGLSDKEFEEAWEVFAILAERRKAAIVNS
jgi:hypothetical protein